MAKFSYGKLISTKGYRNQALLFSLCLLKLGRQEDRTSLIILSERLEIGLLQRAHNGL